MCPKITACLLLAALITSPALAQSTSHPEPIEWTWYVRPDSPSPQLPNVLLLGDSITRAYFPQVKKNLEGAANVYLMATSASVGDPRLPRQIADFATLEHVSFKFVHFNNGMHGWTYTEAQYRAAFPTFLRAIEDFPGHPCLIWATTTPIQADQPEGPTNLRIDARNTIAASFLHPANIAIDDQHALMLSHQDLHQNNVHFNNSGSQLMGDQAAQTIRSCRH